MTTEAKSRKNHLTPPGTYITIGIALLALTGLTVALSFIDFGPWNLIVALTIAASKALLVAFFFMHLYYDNKLYMFIFLLSILILVVFISFTMFDTLKRGEIADIKDAPIKDQAIIYDKQDTDAASQQTEPAETEQISEEQIKEPVSSVTPGTAGNVEYRKFPVIGSRVAIWIVAQLHLMFGAFVLAVPMFAVIIEFIGYYTGDKRYDNLAHDFTKLLSVSFSFTATLGALLTFMLIILYPKVTNYLAAIFSWTFFPYVALFFLEALFLYSYYYGWNKFNPKVHLSLGVALNIVGTLIMFIANAWLTFMNTPKGVTETGALVSVWDAINNYIWMPINIHRMIANVAFGGSIAAAYGAYKFLNAKTEEEKAHYDWMGYVGIFIAISALLPLPFAGYWLGKEIYAYSQSLGIVMMGGTFSWLFIIQAVLIGNLFLAANYYLWLSMERIPGAERYKKFIKYLLASITICFIVWATPHSLLASIEEARVMGGAHHPILGVLGVMSAKNTAVNILILTTYISFLLYRRGNKEAVVAWAKKGNTIKFMIFAITIAFVTFLGVYGYFVEAKVRIAFSIPQVLSVLMAMVTVTIIDLFMFRKAKSKGKILWGKISSRAQYALFFLTITFTWLMGLMGYVRAGLRQHWHVYGVMKDTSPDAFTPTLGFASGVVSVTVIIFFTFIAIIFWLTGLSDRKNWKANLSN